mgnify:CR=1 FL=1
MADEPPVDALIARMELARKLAREAGKILRDMQYEGLHVERKGTIDFVTEADRKSERHVIKGIRAMFPSDAIWAEESGAAESGVGVSWDAGFGWLVDPLDGTTNYLHGIPHVGVSIGVAYKGVPVVGVVLDPFRDELFHAVRGQGAFRNEQPVEVTRTLELSQSLLATGFPYDRRQYIDRLLSRVANAMRESHGVRRFGAASLDLCWVACGRFDGFFEEGLSPWDMCAGAVIIAEAGGVVTTYEGASFDLMVPEFVASNGRIHDALLERVVMSGVGRARFTVPDGDMEQE